MDTSKWTGLTADVRPTQNVSVYERYTEASIMARSYYNKSAAGARNVSRYISFVPDVVADMEQEKHPENVELLVGPPWQVHRVSPLWGVPVTNPPDKNLQDMELGIGTCPNIARMKERQIHQVTYDEKGLKKVAKSLGEIVGQHTEVDLSPLPGLRGNQFDEEALCVSVSTLMQGKKTNIFTGILCSVEAVELRLKNGGATNLPVLLTKGGLDITERVILGLERCFDCVVGRLELPVNELHWMAAMWAGMGDGDIKKDNIRKKMPLGDATNIDTESVERESVKSGSKEHVKDDSSVVKLIYGLPAKLAKEVGDKINHFTFEFPAFHIKEIWRCSRETEDEVDFTEAEMMAFHRSISVHVRQTLGVRLDLLELVQIQLPLLRAHKGGRVAFGSVAQVKTVLRYITELCQGDVLEADPTLAVTGDTDNDSISMDYTLIRGGLN